MMGFLEKELATAEVKRRQPKAMKRINSLDCFKGRQVTGVSLRQENGLD
jgi:hypothetical protein